MKNVEHKKLEPKKLELLSPAKNLETGIAAIKCGADAVYIGAQKFGARAAVGNSLEDIEKLVKFAHKYNAKVYITVNTILTDEEVIAAQKLIKNLYEIGADAIIVQDMGLLELDLPPVPLFASTQTNNTTPEKVKFLEEAGFQRVILARELSLPQIKEIRSQTAVELESFVHGALCVCYSGQCYMSYAIGGRSGNRGDCAQPCRKKYSLVDSKNNIIAKDKYLLSLKDMNLSKHLEDLINAGISSFKIEGRLKDIAYVKNIVSYYRKKLDFIIEEKGYSMASDGKSIISYTPDPIKTFNRGYTEYFIEGKRDKIASINSPKSIGEKIGIVNKVYTDYFTLSDIVTLNNADGICFFDKNNELKGTLVNKIEGNKVFTADMKGIVQGTVIFRNSDHSFLKLLNNSKIERKIAANIYLYQENNSLVFLAVDEGGSRAEFSIENTFELANKQDVALENIKKQLAKLGETDFYCETAEVNLQEIPFIPVAEINEFRRNIIEKLEENRIKSYCRQNVQIEKNNFPYPDDILDYNGNVLNKYAEAFYKRHGVKEILSAAESGLNMNGKKVMTTKYCLRNELGICRKNSPKERYTEPLYLVDEYNHKFELKFDCSRCEMEVFY